MLNKYIDKSEIVVLNLDDATYIHGMLKIHHVEIINETNLDFYLNSRYKHEAVKHRSITFQSNKSSSMAKQASSSYSKNPPVTWQPNEPVTTDQAVDDGLIEIPYDSVSISQWVKVLHGGEMFLGKVLNKQNNAVLARCLSKPFGIAEPQDFDWEIDVVYYNHAYHTKVNPMLSPVGRTCKYTYEIKD